MSDVTTGERSREALDRVIRPRTVAVVGLKDDTPFVAPFEPTMQSDVDIVFVNPKHPEVLGRLTFPSLKDIGQPVDVVLCLTNAGAATAVVEEAAELGVGGVVMVSGGFSEAGVEGKELQRRIQDAAEMSGMAVVGPNGLGLMNVRRKLSLTIAAPHKKRPGGISVVSQSGAMLSGIVMAAWERSQIGLNVLVSAGNEAVTDLADYVDYLADDPDTTAIALVIETIRRPPAFFEAARRAIAAGKPIVALKLGRNARTQEMAASHTGAMTGDAWVYDVAFRQMGISVARDPEELVDRIAIFEQLDRRYWRSVDNLAIVTATGGYASMSMDLATEEGVNVPPLNELRPWVSETLPGVTIPNPLDATGMGFRKWDEILETYGASSGTDAVFFVHPLADEDGSAGSQLRFRNFADAAVTHGKPFVVSNCAGELGSWAQSLAEKSPGVAVGRGPRAALQGIHSMSEYVRRRPQEPGAAVSVRVVPRPSAAPVSEPEGLMLPFAATMSLLEEAGIPAAPYKLIAEDEPVVPPEFDGPYVVKLADVAHRTEYGAVELSVTEAGLEAAVESMRDIAGRNGLRSTVAVQPSLEVNGEAFLGIQSTELGPMVVFGLGGIFIEVINRIGGRLAPFDRDEAHSLLAEFDDVKIMNGFRGRRAWDRDLLVDLLVSVGDLAAGSAGWLESFDVNPLLVTGSGFCAVDALCLVMPDDAGSGVEV